MSTKHSISLPNREETLSRNAKIDTSVVAAHERLEKDLNRLGVEIKPSYNLASPWRLNRTPLHGRTRVASANSNRRRLR